MKPLHVVALLMTTALGAAIWFRPGSAQLPNRDVGRGDEIARHEPVAERSTDARPARGIGEGQGTQRTVEAGDRPSIEMRTSAPARERAGMLGSFETPQRLVWPARRTTHPTDAPAAEPVVPVRLAFRALWYLGTDPTAERTWTRAINDPTSPPGVRSDLIVDMIDEGYTDNEHPTAEDLPVILARLEIIERHAPYAMDDVNRRAFAEAYRHLLDMYVRLGGAPRDVR